MAIANHCRMSYVDRLKGYGASVLTGGGTLVGMTVAMAAIMAGISMYRFGLNDSVTQMMKFISDRKWTMTSDSQLKLILAGQSVSIVGTSLAATVKHGWSHHCDITSNSEYVDMEINHCKKEMIKIYDGIKLYFERLNLVNKCKVAPVILERMPEIKNVMKIHGIDPTEIVGNLEYSVAGWKFQESIQRKMETSS